MNKPVPAERLVRLFAFVLCALVYAAGVGLFFQTLEESQPPVSAATAIRMDFAQMELSAAAPQEPLPDPEPEEPEPEPEPEPEVMPEPEDADVALEQVVEKPKPEPVPEPIVETVPERTIANVTQEASAPVIAVNPESLQSWVIELLEKEKYYPPAAERFGLRGTFGMVFTIEPDGTIQSVEIQDGRGHRILRQALEKMLSKIRGRNFGKPIGEAVAFEIDFEFE